MCVHVRHPLFSSTLLHVFVYFVFVHFVFVYLYLCINYRRLQVVFVHVPVSPLPCYEASPPLYIFHFVLYSCPLYIVFVILYFVHILLCGVAYCPTNLKISICPSGGILKLSISNNFCSVILTPKLLQVLCPSSLLICQGIQYTFGYSVHPFLYATLCAFCFCVNHVPQKLQCTSMSTSHTMRTLFININV